MEAEIATMHLLAKENQEWLAITSKQNRSLEQTLSWYPRRDKPALP